MDELYDDAEWEGGPIETGPVDRTLPEQAKLLDEEIDNLERLDELNAEELAVPAEQEIEDPGISAIPEDSGQYLDQEIQTLEENEPFQLQEEDTANLEPPEPLSTEILDNPDDVERVDAPPASLKEFLERGGEIGGGMGALPGAPAPSNDGPISPITQYLNSSYSLSQQTSDVLIDHANSLDMLLEAVERSRL